jgi:oxygen-independent coproporphyrinogen III oxidase
VPGLYIHIPFCIRKCAYCDFYSLPQRLDQLPAYLDAVLAEAQLHRGLSFETLYLGGGTPSLLGAGGIHKLREGLQRTFDLAGLTEATMEANPESATPELLQAAREAGINRISIGVQSLSDAELLSVGRVHNASQAVLAVKAAQKNEFSNVSADVILGLPGQDWTSLMITLETLIGLDIRHISVYCLALEPHTSLYASPPSDLPSEDTQAELYENVCALLSERGFVHYEISNFALPGYECRHNLNYWRGGEYLGLGPAAASHLNNIRFRNKADLDAYLKNPGGQIEEVEDLPAPEKAAEEAVLRLRLLQEGLPINDLAEKYGDEHILDLASRLDQLVKEGNLLRHGAVYRLAPSRALVSNTILARVL